jgi:hypothetical protein
MLKRFGNYGVQEGGFSASFTHMGRNSLFPVQSVTEAGQGVRWVGGSENLEFVSPEMLW